MQNKSLKNKLAKALVVFIAFVIFDFILNFTLYSPQFITPIYHFAAQKKLINPETTGYSLISLRLLNSGLYSSPHAAIIGDVEEVVKSGDSDWHMDIKNAEGVLVAEIIPEYPLPVPAVGDHVKIWGITRFDLAHRWWELHPVIGWEKVAQ